MSARNPGIDLVRGVSILLVVVHHTAIRVPLMKTALAGVLPAWLLVPLSWDGYEAVFVFFVVSGFLITRNSLGRAGGDLARLDLRAFYARRAARILPCLLVLLAILAVLDLARVPDFIIDDHQSLGRALMSALLLHLNWYEGRTGYLPANWDVLWSLSIEELFYLCFPIVCLTLGRSRAMLAVAIGVLALSLPVSLAGLAHASEIWREKAYLPGMAAIAMGVGAALLARTASPVRALAATLGWSATAILALLFVAEDAVAALLGTGLMLLLTAAVACLMIAFDAGWGARLASTRTAWVRAMGRRSYEIYLTHMFVVLPALALFHRAGGTMWWGFLIYPPIIAGAAALGAATDALLSTPADRAIRARVGVIPAGVKQMA